MRIIIFSVGVLFIVSACGASQDELTQTMPPTAIEERSPMTEMASEKDKITEAAIITGIAATAQVVQEAKSMDPDRLPMDQNCCAKCPQGTFPCGNECKPQGLLPPCLEPPGCACYDGEETTTTSPQTPPVPADQFPTNAE